MRAAQSEDVRQPGTPPDEPATDGVPSCPEGGSQLAEKGHREFTRFRPYDLRHTFGGWAITGDPARGVPGVDISTLRAMMGHEDISTTQRYAHHASDRSQHGARVVAAAMGVVGRVGGNGGAGVLGILAKRLGVGESELITGLLAGRIKLEML